MPIGGIQMRCVRILDCHVQLQISIADFKTCHFFIAHTDWQRSNPHCGPQGDSKVTFEMTELINKLPTAASGDNEARGWDEKN
jgi:hypothetical protein